MKMLKAVAAIATLSLGLAGCYHATVETGRAPNGQTIERAWAHGFVYGLVPPSAIETASQCANGVARVDTELSFLNQVASFFTFGLYTPMTITVACAAAGIAVNEVEIGEPANLISVREGGDRTELARALEQAAEQSATVGAPVYVQFTAFE